jgi:glycosyltransferase involved in cell wall biosynthesis
VQLVRKAFAFYGQHGLLSTIHRSLEKLHFAGMTLRRRARRFFDARIETVAISRGNRSRYRILSYRWHPAHQYELYKLPSMVTLVDDLGTKVTRAWDFGQRPLPGNVVLRPWRTVDVNEFDLAILHFDENVLAPENTNGALGADWGAAFRFFLENVRLPKIAVCHGTPQFHGQYDFNYRGEDLLQVIESTRKQLVDYLGDTLVVCNSHQAAKEWGFRRSKVIWHGFDPEEFAPALYQRGILSPLGPSVMSRPHYRGYFLYQQVFENFPPEFAPSTLAVREPSRWRFGNAYARAKFRNYIDEIRRYSVYFNPTLRSPMPRGRGEAMMCGLVTVNANNHDVDRFIRNGVDGFYSSDAGELREHLLYLMRNPDAVRRIGAQGRQTAVRTFHISRYLADWHALIRATI